MFRKLYLNIFMLVLLWGVWPGMPYSLGEATGQLLWGASDAPIRIEIFSNFNCLVCQELYLKTIRPFMRGYEKRDKVCIVYHELPMKTDPYSGLAAQYSEAAYRLGRDKLLLVMDALYGNQAQWTKNGNIEAVVSKVLPQEDVRRIKAILNVPSIGGAIDNGIDHSIEKNIEALPTMVILSGNAYQKEEGRSQGYLGYMALKQYIDRILQ
jgi:protein-disulfide isomerase